MNKLIFRAAAAVASLLCLLLTSCNHRELCYDHEHWIDLQVAFDWSEEPAAAPATMVVWFFPADAETEGRAFLRIRRKPRRNDTHTCR